ncbi:hypothetical protein GX51_03733 [Blastomyces parvus]|uniref:Uncharacterized protein n=1 Tax=Blastomyces parvus TaxID=2060905 RepID=A0A2B7X5J9_9EURO|nr:hypothetical protein GX51_03733 [Blastomyces parvus]
MAGLHAALKHISNQAMQKSRPIDYGTTDDARTKGASEPREICLPSCGLRSAGTAAGIIRASTRLIGPRKDHSAMIKDQNCLRVRCGVKAVHELTGGVLRQFPVRCKR